MLLSNCCVSMFLGGNWKTRSSRPGGGEKMTMRTEKLLLAIMIAALTAGVAATASETVNYTYDARGRLVQVKHSGTVNNNVTANYQYDKADNRTNVNIASPNPAP
jgi:YD repeat-containing protein